ncbi:MAG TPA: GntR family transcriptional regulator [Acidimicrobiales bacterium]|nr:GntR family transcriptional regulator [Acidimicrobiales bacterium]
MNLAPVARRSVVDGAYEQLAAEILDGRLVPGEVLPAERALTELLGVNRQAVREALQRLAQDGLVTIQHGGATRVREFRQTGALHLLPRLVLSADGKVDRSVIRSVIEMRLAIGPDVARLAAQRARPEHLARVADAAAVLDDGSVPAVRRSHVNLDLWDALVDASDNIAYRFAYNSLRASFEPVAGFVADYLTSELDDVKGRRRLLTAVRDGKPEAAEAAARKLLAASSAALTGLVAQLPEEFVK